MHVQATLQKGAYILCYIQHTSVGGMLQALSLWKVGSWALCREALFNNVHVTISWRTLRNATSVENPTQTCEKAVRDGDVLESGQLGSPLGRQGARDVGAVQHQVPELRHAAVVRAPAARQRSIQPGVAARLQGVQRWKGPIHSPRSWQLPLSKQHTFLRFQSMIGSFPCC